jgi:hypothetical protein
MRAVNATRYRGVDRVRFSCKGCGEGFTVVDAGPFEAAFMGIVGIVAIAGPWVRPWRDDALGEQLALVTSFNTRSSEWQNAAGMLGLSLLSGIPALWMFLSWVRMRLAMARHPVA